MGEVADVVLADVDLESRGPVSISALEARPAGETGVFATVHLCWILCPPWDARQVLVCPVMGRKFDVRAGVPSSRSSPRWRKTCGFW